MDSDEIYHSESEFYYPDEIYNNSRKAGESIDINRNLVDSNENDDLMDDINDYILAL